MSSSKECMECGGSMTLSVEPHQYDAGGVIVLIENARIWSCEACRDEELEIQNLQGLHGAIAGFILRERRPLTGPELRWLRKFIGIPRDLFAPATQVSAETLRAWEEEETPDRRYAHAIRSIARLRARITDFEDFEAGFYEPRPARLHQPRLHQSDGQWTPTAA